MNNHFKKPAIFLFFLSFIFFISLTVNAQDVIIKNDKSEIKAKVLEITDDAVKYKKFDFQDGPTYNLKKAEIFMILYKNGQRETFPTPENKPVPPQENKPVNPPSNGRIMDPGIITKPENTATNTDKPESDNPNQKKQDRYIGGISITFYTPASAPDIADISVGPKLAFEKIGQNPAHPNIGLGFCFNSFLDIGGYDYSGMSPYMSKYFLSTYLIGEYDLKNIVTFGATGGISGVINSFSDEASEASSTTFGAGLHFSQYLQKYIGKNKDGEKAFFMRWGFDQYFSINSGYTNGGFFVFGF